MTITFGDIVRCTVQYTLLSDEVHQNVFHYRAGIGVSDTEANVVAAIGGLMDTAYQTLNTELSTDVLAGEASFAKLNSGTGKWEQIGSFNMTQPVPSGSGVSIANGLAAVVRFLADGVGNQGRKFLGGFDSGSVTENSISAALVVAINNWSFIVVGPVTVSGGLMDPGWWSVADVLHRAYNGSWILNTLIGYQRRRKPGLGI